MSPRTFLPPDVVVSDDTAPDGELVMEQFAPVLPAGVDMSVNVAEGPDPERRAELIAERNRQREIADSFRSTYGMKARARGRIREINAELAGNADQKEVAKWLKARAKKGLGSFDIELVTRVLPLFPGWQVEDAVVTATETNLTYADDERKKGWRWFYRSRDEHPFRVVGADAAGRPVIPGDADPDQHVIYVPSAPESDDAHGRVLAVRYPTVLRRVYRFTAPSGEQKDVLVGAENADGFYKWAYSQGLDRLAAAALPAAEAAVPKAASTAAVSKGQGTCPVCFGVHAVTKAQDVMDHGYRRPGWGFNVSPCDGTKWPRYEDSPNGTAAFLRSLELRLDNLIHWQRDLGRRAYSDGSPVALKRTVYVLDAKGQRVLDDSDRALAYAEAMRAQGLTPEPQYKTRTETLLPGMKHYEKMRERYLERTAAEITALRRTIPFYRVAVRLWRKGGVPLSELYREARTERVDGAVL